MSEDVAFKGKLIPTGKTLDEVMADIEFPTCYDPNDQEDVLELFMDKFYQEKVVIDGYVFDVEKTDVSSYEMFEANKLSNDVIEFIVKYYNGGCGFDEAIHKAIKNMK